MENILLRPYRDAGFPTVGAISRWMIRVRYHLFGETNLASLAGRDEFGRDVLSRVFWGARISIVVGIVATFVSLRDRRDVRRGFRLRRRLVGRRDDAVRRYSVLDSVHLRRDFHDHDAQR